MLPSCARDNSGVRTIKYEIISDRVDQESLKKFQLLSNIVKFKALNMCVRFRVFEATWICFDEVVCSPGFLAGCAGSVSRVLQCWSSMGQAFAQELRACGAGCYEEDADLIVDGATDSDDDMELDEADFKEFDFAKMGKARQSVAAEITTEMSEETMKNLPSKPKTAEQSSRIKAAMAKSDRHLFSKCFSCLLFVGKI